MSSWVIYVREENWKPVVLMADTELCDKVDQFAEMAVVKVPYKSLPNGLPLPDENVQLGTISEQVEKSLIAQGYRFAGQRKTNGLAEFCFLGFRKISDSVTIKRGLFKTISLPVELKGQKRIEYFDEFIRPTKLEIAIHSNRQLIETLAKMGDQPNIPRDVDFAFFSPASAVREALLTELCGLGFELNSEGKWEVAGQFWFAVKKMYPTDEQTMAHVKVELQEIAKKQGSVFDGWACHVMN